MAKKKGRVVVPVRFPTISDTPTRTKLFLTPKQIEQMRANSRFIEAKHVDYQPLRLPTGEVIKSVSLQGKKGALAHMMAAKSSHFLIGMSQRKLDEFHRINDALKKKGVPVVRILEDYKGKKPGERLVLIEGEKSTLYNLNRDSPNGLPIADAKKYFEALGTLHSLGVSHNHPHLGNFFRRNGKAGVFDFSNVKFGNVDWKSPERIIDFFQVDYSVALDNFLMTAVRNKRLQERIKQEQIGDVLQELVKPLPASQRVKQVLVEELENSFFDVLIPHYREHGFFKTHKMDI
ncbi:MAG: hypothetical protein ABIH20_04580 [Candidatus Diapherotrites archaeon]